MGAAHGVMGAPSEGTAQDVRFTRSKDNTTLYAILLGWQDGRQDIVLKSLSSDRIDLKGLTSVALINGKAGQYLPLTFKQDAKGLTVRLPQRSFDELAYVLKLNFEGTIPTLDQYADLNCTPHYYIVPGNSRGDWVLNSELTLTQQSKKAENQWTLERVGKGIYKILNRADSNKTFEYRPSAHDIVPAEFTGKDSQCWKIDNASNGWLTIANQQQLLNV